ncbi:hypothetical protein NEF87_001881 [Candidatus Lokiarchaeum ossiferum]|uniref:DUF4443 domain-containing protein n=1 Tax=Candidatus Lokiarchaeum ossiferum TaxID=2951803 RepID=A0ABY6HQ05_9ARCH|nr:hypothetical protein NEF87_001881 [Candidatus Lokiarchaeum sp. B-35]
MIYIAIMAEENEINLTKVIKKLYESKTIAPSYKTSHIIYTIMFLGNQEKGIGRYRIKDEVGLGEGAMKTLLNRLRDETVIKVEVQRQKGHVLTDSGRILSNRLNSMFHFPEPLENRDNNYVVGKCASYTIIKCAYLKEDYSIGIQQRDEAIKIGGTGATCLTFDGKKLIFPGKDHFSPNIQGLNIKGIKKNDLVLIGGGNTPQKANLSVFAAVLSLLKLQL